MLARRYKTIRTVTKNNLKDLESQLELINYLRFGKPPSEIPNPQHSVPVCVCMKPTRPRQRQNRFLNLIGKIKRWVLS